MSRVSDTRPAAVDQLSALVYELLNAHCDTVLLADEMSGDLQWGAHLDYLRDLQRAGRETLARVAKA